MDTPILGMICMFGFDFAPRNWAKCDGQLMSISANQALFSLLGTIYGGDGRTTFGLPDLRGRAALHEGSGPGLSPRTIGARGGAETTTLTVPNMPAHTHTAVVGGSVQLPVSGNEPDTDSPSGAFLSAQSDDFYNGAASAGEFAGALSSNLTVTNTNTGGNLAFNNMQPFLVINYCIATQGLYPSRT
ncbi:MAG: phage tail protein [Bacteroidetes bacterium]|nr:phage tail protein [Bacteroidota bacterium]